MIEVKDLSKSYGPIRAVDRVSFSVAEGEVLGFLGPNGAGKTTTMKMLSCFMPPDSGTARVAGCDIVEQPIGVRRSVGYLAENAPTYDEMTPATFLNFVCAARGMSRAERKRRISETAETCAIADVMHQIIATLSKGYRRRLGLAQALIHDPPVLVLDEPTDGLDPNQKRDVRDLIKTLAPRKCIIISTHVLEEVDAVCSRIVIINRGRLLLDDTPDALRKREGAPLDVIFRKHTTPRPVLRKKGGAK